jgi:hypothetical protein
LLEGEWGIEPVSRCEVKKKPYEWKLILDIFLVPSADNENKTRFIPRKLVEIILGNKCVLE